MKRFRSRLSRLLPLVLVFGLCGLCGASSSAERAWPELEPVGSGSSTDGRDAALLVTIGDYAWLPDVPGAALNARDWAHYLLSARSLPDDALRRVEGEQATRAGIEAGLTEALAQVDEGGTLWVVFTGHAVPDFEGIDTLLLAADSRVSPLGLRERAYTLGELWSVVERSGVQRAIVVVDGSLGGLDYQGEPLVPDLDLPEVPAVPTPPASVVLLGAAAPGAPPARLPGWDRPAFGYLVLAGLRGWADGDGDEVVSWTELQDWLQDTLGTVLPHVGAEPVLRSGASQVDLGVAWEPGPDLLEVLVKAGEQRLQKRVELLRAAEQALVGAARSEWEQLRHDLQEGEPGALERAKEYVERYRAANVQVDHMRHWVPVPEITQAATWLPQDANPDTRERRVQVERRVQLTEEMESLGQRGIWKGVEDAFLETEALYERGIPHTRDTLFLGAQAARALGRPDRVYERLVRLVHLVPDPVATRWLNDLERNYGRVKLSATTRRKPPLDTPRMPLAPDQREAVTAVQEILAEDGEYEGPLPGGVYTYGDRTFVLVPGDPPVRMAVSGRSGR